MLDTSQKVLSARVGKVTAILSSATLSLLLVGAGCAPAPAANVSVNTETSVTVPPVNAPVQETAPEKMPEEAPKKTDEPATKPSATAPVSKKYQDGSYDAEGYYRSPAGSEKIGVSLVLKDDKIVSVNVSVEATNPKSIAMQTAFAGGISAVVVGKSIDEVNVGKVSGSSLTGAGFNEAVAKIKVEAKS